MYARCDNVRRIRTYPDADQTLKSKKEYFDKAIMNLSKYLIVQANIVSQLGMFSQLEIASPFHVPHDPESGNFF
jgi:hypothetical protein